MQFKHLLIVSAVSLIMVSCVGTVSKNQDTVNASVSPTPTSVKPLSQSTTSQNLNVNKYGAFTSGEHTTQGIAHITTKNGKSILELDKSFKTSTSGPDLVVLLHRSDNVLGSTQPPSYPLKKDDYVIIAPLQKYSGAQSYEIPKNINLADYKSAAIWCRKFNATFGAARLSS
ncbi:DM13 domain-containing protein [Tolypothrix sp. PCC 7910]|uniref:DM13 domain-containing protein n=1 Tax=Tolypothrix sp. PCC 7910 TaxID=2099387 RepID=UPI0014278296|nr:DM13 domain-containing protein [Tolypothrix sp. PCC 7910]QIR36538.1 DM13 domain-containing protein [Tolypothrix sp. PCC 7910]